MSPQDPPIWIELVKAIPSVVTAITAVVGVAIAVRGLNKWRAETIGKRKAEVAEETLTAFYQAREIIQSVRHPGWEQEESNLRKKEEWETEDDTRTLNRYFSVLSRLDREQQFFSQVFSSSYRFIAIFGPEAGQPYNDLFVVRKEIITAAWTLIECYRSQEYFSGTFLQAFASTRARPVPLPPEKAPPPREALPINRKGLEARIRMDYTAKSDPIQVELDRIVEAIEKTCRPAVQEGFHR